jgi:tetratricopeptide (TPR) repeat protein
LPEVAQNFREQGNDCFRAGKAKYPDAISFYTKAIETECSDNNIIEACLANRAACNLELKNYGRVLNDCSKCLEINPQNVKALYRSARALFALDKLVETIDCCDHALITDPENKAVKDIREKALTRKNMIDEKIRQKQEKEERERNKKQILEKAFKVKRRINLGIIDRWLILL